MPALITISISLDNTSFIRREGGAEGVTARDKGGLEFRIVKFRMQNSSAQTTVCGRDDVFLLSGRNSNICGRYDLFFFAHHLIMGHH